MGPKAKSCPTDTKSQIYSHCLIRNFKSGQWNYFYDSASKRNHT